MHQSHLFILLFLVFGDTFAAKYTHPKYEFSIEIDPSRIEIVRDSFGVPHIFAPTDAEVAYGLAWATAEDDIENSQFMLLAIRGVLAKKRGIEGAKIDFAVQMLEVNDYVYDNYEALVSEDYKKVLEGYALGINAYAKAHPKAIWIKGLLPVVPQDLVVGHMLGIALMGGIEGTLTRIVDGGIVNQIPEEIRLGTGSNAFAFNSKKTKDGRTYLAVNAHQPIEGLLSWYEAHLHSDEGWNIVGALFHGSCQAYLGTNQYLGWGHTTGHIDMTDVYQLEMNPKKKLEYKFDGEWKKLETKVAKLRVGFGKKGNFRLPIRKKYWISVYGPTLKTKHGTFAIRMPAIRNLFPAEQWYRMNKATNFEEFYQALELQGLSMQNITYADRYDNIFFIANGVVPKRADGYDWQKVLPGTGSETLWDEYLPNDSLCSFKNPECGWLFNTNNAGFEATTPSENKKLSDFNPHIGYKEDETNRSRRTQEIMASFEGKKMDFEDFKALKYDHSLPLNPTYKSEFELSGLFELDEAAYPDIADAIQRIKSFDREADWADTNYPILMYTIYMMLDQYGKFLPNNEIQQDSAKRAAFYVHCIGLAKNHMMKHFGTLDKQTDEVQVVKRGEKTIGLAGGPDMNRAVYGNIQEDGTVAMWVGDGYYQLVRFQDDRAEIETIHMLGASSYPESPHFNDQMDLAAKHLTKKMPLEKEAVYKMAERVYHPMP